MVRLTISAWAADKKGTRTVLFDPDQVSKHEARGKRRRKKTERLARYASSFRRGGRRNLNHDLISQSDKQVQITCRITLFVCGRMT